MASIDERLEKLKKQKEELKAKEKETFSTESKCGTEETHETID